MRHDAFYFGRWGHGGHEMHAPRDEFVNHDTIRKTVPTMFRCLMDGGTGIDGVLQPGAEKKDERGLVRRGKHFDEQGAALLHHSEGWTCIAFWDRSGDRRGNSNGAFILRGTLDFDAAIAMARQNFPELFERFTFEIRQVTP